MHKRPIGQSGAHMIPLFPSSTYYFLCLGGSIDGGVASLTFPYWTSLLG
jgi:hypothetical protein